MKRILSFYYIKFLSFCQALALFCLCLTPVFSQNVSAVSANDFYFENAEFNYYLEKAEDGTSNLHVEEVLTAIFPETNQNHGITRSIPYTNQNGKNITASSIDALNLKVTRNGQAEQIARTETENGNYIFYLGSSNSYVHGRQVYTLSYDFKNVITEFNNARQLTYNNQNAAFQELYWDTNGTGWSQKFENLSASLYFSDDIAASILQNKTSCYVGRYGDSGSSRCNIATGSNSITFSTTNLSGRENLTFAVDFKPNTFSVPEPAKNYLLVVITAVIAAICLLIIILNILSYNKKAKAKKHFYKGLFDAPQYDAPKNYFVAEAAELYLKNNEKTYVATLLELAISKKISIVKGEPTKVLKKDTWIVKVNDIDGISDSQEDLLRILNGGPKVHNGDEIKVQKHTATATLASLSRSYRNDAVAKLEKLKLFESKTTTSSAKNALISVISVFVFVFITFSVSSSFISSITSEVFSAYGNVVGVSFLPAIIIAIIIATIVISAIISTEKHKYSKYTNAGLKEANYLDGLYLYINMAEKDRLKFLQSVKGADTSKEGIIHLYEKLLPYACLFGVEESWAKELGKYCKEIDYDPDWYPGGDLASFYVMSSIASSINTSVAASTSYTSSSSSSSGFSGGGGGGFSGGGGGGGGGGGW